MQQGEIIDPNPQMENHLLRLATFGNLPESASLSPCMASKAGFYYTGEGDTVGCYSCGLRLNNWESGVHPMTAHRELSPDCQFVVTQHGDDVSAEQVVSQIAPTSRPSSQLPQSHNHHQRRRRGYNSRQDYYRQLASAAGSLRLPADTSIDRTSNDSSIVSSRLPHSNVDRFTSRQMMQRINYNDPSLLEEMKYERQRVSSYTNWPRDTNIEPEALAQAGLFYLCRADRVKCAFCHGILRNWEPSEEPTRKHRRLFPSCPFLRDPRAAGNVALGEEPGEQQMLNVTSNTTSNCSTGQLGIETARPRHPAMAVEAARLASFDRWPRSSPVSPESLARAGFYCTGAQNTVCCFFCDGRINSWQPNDDPMTEHRRRFPQCGFLRLTSDAEDERTAATESSHELSSVSDMTTTPSMAAGQGNSAATSQNPTMTCKVCLDAEMNTLFLPCGHLVCCGHCAVALSTCPICRSDINGTVRTYLA